MKGRIVGMSRLDSPGQLLSQIGNKPRPARVEPAVDDPPLSSDEEDDEASPPHNHEVSVVSDRELDDEAVTDSHQEVSNDKSGATPQRHSQALKALDTLSDDLARGGCEGAGKNAAAGNQWGTSGGSDSSGDERSAQANMKRTDFSKATEVSKPSQDMESHCRTESPKLETRPLREAQTTSSKRRRLNEETLATTGWVKEGRSAQSSMGHQTNEYGFTIKKEPKNTYQKKSITSRARSEREAAATVSNSTMKVPKGLPGSDSPDRSKSIKLRVPETFISSPTRSPRRSLIVKRHRDDVSSEEEKSTLEAKGFKRNGPRMNEPTRRQRKGESAVPRVPSPPPALFKLPAQISEFTGRTGDSNEVPDGEPSGHLSDRGSDWRPSNSEDVFVAGEEPTAAATVCPWCGEPVDKALLDASSKGKRMNVRQQKRFCEKHRKQTAVETWKAKGYPDVDWTLLNRRFAEHHNHLLDIVNGKPSHFRSILEERIQSGKVRSMKKEDNLNPGYYGPRGFNTMCDYLVNEFGDLLKEKAVNDRVIAGRGSAAFIQSVLVAELAVQLIKDDLHVSVSEARNILEESKALGEMVHDEV